MHINQIHVTTFVKFQNNRQSMCGIGIICETDTVCKFNLSNTDADLCICIELLLWFEKSGFQYEYNNMYQVIYFRKV